MSQSSRRGFIVALGLAPTCAIASEKFVNPPPESGIQLASTGYSKERFANALWELGVGIRDGSIEPHDIQLSSSFSRDEIADIHEIRIKLRYMPEGKS